MIDPIYYLFGSRIKRKLYALEYRPKGFDKMTVAFNGPDGRAYYTWAELGDLPAVRTKQIERTMIWIDARVTHKSIDEFGEDLNSALAEICQEKDQKKRWERSTRLGALYKELILRSANVIPEDLYYDLAATLVVAEDEDPGGFDGAIHQRKMDLMKEGARGGASFFFDLPILKGLLGSSLSSEAAFRELLISWMMDRERSQIARQVLSSASAPKSTARSSTTSPTGSAAKVPTASTP